MMFNKFVLFLIIVLHKIKSQQELDLRIFNSEIQVYREGQFKAVCDDGQTEETERGTISETTAIVICQQMGYKVTNFSQISLKQSQNCLNGSNFGLDDLYCANSSLFHIKDCNKNLGTHNCIGTECLHIECGVLTEEANNCKDYNQITRQCQDCDDKFYWKETQCEACEYYCGTCENSANNCFTCSEDNRSMDNTIKCSCNTGYYENNLLKCDLCKNECTACNSINICTGCKEGFYLNGNNCLQCDHSKCATCQTNEETCILACNQDCKECDTSAKCTNCVEGKFLNNSQQCVDCDNTICATCYNNATSCILNCNSDCKTCGVDKLCTSCNDGLYEKNGQCLSCDDSKCATCQTTQTNCLLQCNNDCKTCNINGKCTSCIEGRFINNLLECQLCDNTLCATCQNQSSNCILECNSDCKTCQTDQTCTSCQVGHYLIDGKCEICNNRVCGTCISQPDTCLINCNLDCNTCDVTGKCTSCQDGKFLNTQQECVICDNSLCATCQISSQTCILECNQDCKTCQIDQQCNSCLDGKYLTEGKCLQCDHTKCATCLQNSQQCILDCDSSCKECNNQQKCTSCNAGLFINSNQLCQLCDNTRCGSCIGTDVNCIVMCDSTCKTCNIDGTCKSCELGYFLDQNNGNKCSKCDFKCKKCVETAENCVECIDNLTRDKGFDNSCLCKRSYFQIDQEFQCKECNFKCETCGSRPDNCLSCINDSRSNVPTCNCADGYYDDIITGDCLQCKYNCKCSVFNLCDECLGLDKQFRQLPTCMCIQGYYEDDNKICLQCLNKCKTCTQQQNNCLICQRGYKRTLQAPECGCQVGYYEEQNNLNCKECQSHCSQCNDGVLCTECTNSNFIPPLCVESKISSQSFSVDNQGKLIPLKCNIRCQNCENTYNNCTQCNLGQNRSIIIPGCQCLQGYHDFENTKINCTKCQKPCLTCISPTKCTSCSEEDNRYYDVFEQKCKCQQFFIEIKYNSIQSCVPCFQYDNRCFQKCPDNTIMDEKKKICQIKSIKALSSKIFIIMGGILVILIYFISIVLFKGKISSLISKQLNNKPQQKSITNMYLSKESKFKSSQSNSCEIEVN